MFGRFKDKISKAFKADLEKLDAMYFLDEEFCDLYQHIGIDLPDENPNRVKTRKASQEEPEVGRLVQSYIRVSSSGAEMQHLSHEDDGHSSDVISEQ